MKRLTHQGISKTTFTFFLFYAFLTLNAQELSREELESRADMLFFEKQYVKATELYESLYALYPKEPKNSYCLGRCYLATNQMLDESINLMRFAASRNYDPDVHYYLAEAYYKNYQFDEAEISIWNYKNLASKKKQKQLDIEYWEQAIIKSREDNYMVRKIKVVSSEDLITAQIEGVFSKHISGKFKKMPDAFMAEFDKELTYQGVMYYPETTEEGYMYVFSSFGKNGKNEKDIYITEKLIDTDYTLPIAVSTLNSLNDEEYPYFDQNSQVLYFCSNRKGGLGGYDIYSSKYNKSDKSFEAPEPLEFPINSAFDDFLFVPDADGKMAIFLSNRLFYGENLTAYKIEQSESPDYVFPKSASEIQKLASLKVAIPATETLIVMENISPVALPQVSSQYDLYVQKALSKQIVCDSIQGVMLNQKNLLRITSDANERRVLLASIASLELKLTEEQQLADELFSKAQSVSQQNQEVKNEPVSNENVELAKDVNGLKVYTYLPSKQYSDKKIQPEAQKEVIPTVDEPVVDQITNFKILPSSPYNETTPIPVDQQLPEGLVYRIQLGAFGQKLPMSTFGGLSPVSAEIIEGRNLTKYYVGFFPTTSEAHSALEDVKNYGFGDAFIVPYYNKEKVSINHAREIEFEEKNLQIK